MACSSTAMKSLRILFSVILLPWVAQAQQKPFSIGAGLIAKQDNYSFKDPGQRLLTDFFDESHVRRSVFARWTPSARWSTEVGIDFIQNSRPRISYSFPIQRVFSGFSGSRERQPQYTVRQYYTPVSIGRIDKFWLTLGLYGGGAFTTHKTKSSGTLTQAINSGVLDPVRNQTETVSGVTRSTYPNRVTFSTEAGFHIGVLLGARWLIRYQLGWHQGFGETIRTNVEYVSSFEPGITNRATITSNGSGASGGLSVAYLFGRKASVNVPDNSLYGL